MKNCLILNTEYKQVLYIFLLSLRTTKNDRKKTTRNLNEKSRCKILEVKKIEKES